MLLQAYLTVRLSRQNIGRYEIQAVLGRGGFGEVYRAFDPGTDRMVAIKTLNAADDPEMVKRFKNEAAAAGRLRHPNIVVIHHFDDFEGTPYLVMELLDGEDLERIITSRRPLGLLQKVDIIKQAAAGLNHAHRRGILHRDVKPANIMLQHDNVVKIVDFGIALFTQAAAVRLSMPGAAPPGTLLYMAPEQLLEGGDAVSDALTDIFQFGITSYRLLTATHAFYGETQEAVKHNIRYRDPEPIRSISPDCPEALEQVIFKMLAKDRDHRYQNLEDVGFDLEPVIAELKKERVTELLAEARVLIAAQELEKAASVLREALEAEPGNRVARDLRETLQRQLRDAEIRPRIDDLAKEGREHLKARRYDAAINTFRSAQLLNKTDPELQKLLGDALACRNRAEEAKKFFDNAQQALDRGELTSAHAQLLQALSRDPEHPEAGALRETIEQSIGARERARQLEEGINRARRLMVLENFEEAVEDLQALVHDHPDSPPARDLLNAAVQERDHRIHRNRLAAVLGEARTLLKKERFADAVDRLSQWRKEFPESGELRDLASFAADELRNQAQATAVATVTSEAQSWVAQLRFDQAVDRLRQVLTEYPTATALRDLMQSIGAAQSEHERRTALDQVSVQAKSLLGEQRFGEALESISAFARAYGDDGQLEPLRLRAEAGLDQQRRQHAVRKVAIDARTKLDANQPDSAMEDLRLGVTKFPDDPELRTLLKEAQQKLEEQRLAEKISVIISEAESLSRARQFERALETLDQGLVDFPAQDRLLRCRQATLAGKARYDRVMAYGQAVEAIRGLMKTGHLDEALSRADTAIAELGEDPTLADLRRQIAAALESRADRAEVEHIEAQAKALLAQGEPAAALKVLNAAIVRFPAQDSLTNLKALADAQFRQHQRLGEIESVAAKARQDLEAGQVDQAFQAVEAAVRRLGNEGPLVLLKEQILAAQGEAKWRKSRRELIDGVRRLESGKRHVEAFQRLTEALPEFDRDPELLALKSSLEAAIETQRREQEAAGLARDAGRLLTQGRADAAIQMIEAAPQHLGDPRVAPVLASARQRLEEQRRVQASADVERHVQRLVEGGEFTQALKAVDRALHLESTSARLSKLRQSVLTAQETAQHLSAAQMAHAAGDSEKALADIRAGLVLSPTHTVLRDLKRQVEGQIAQRMADAAIGECVAQGEQLLAANQAAEAIAILRPMSRKYPAEARLAQVLKAAEEELRHLEREQDLVAVKARAEALVFEQRYAEALDVVAARFPAEPRFAELVAGAQAQLDLRRRKEGFERAWSRLLAIEQRVPLTNGKSKLKKLLVEMRQAREGFESDADLSQLCARIEQQVDAVLNAPAPPPRALPWKWIGTGSAVAAAVAAGLFIWPKLFEKPLVFPVEIRTEPSGALVTAAGRPCTAPDCRFELPAGRYPIEAKLQGYLPARREIVVDPKHPTGPTVLTLEPEPARPPIIPPPKPPAGVQVAKLVVNAHVPDAQVFIDNKPYGLTDTRGELRTTIEIGDHAVRVEKQGFGVPPVQRVRLKADPKPQLLTFTVNPLPGAPKLPDPPKNDPSVPSIIPPVAPPVLTAEAKEAQAWDRIKTAQDPDQIDAFLRDHPTSLHRQDAAKRLDDVLWARTNPADSASLQAYLKRNGNHAVEARQYLDDIAWSQINKTNPQALRALLDQNPPSRHKAEAQDLLDRLNRDVQLAEARRSVEEKRVKLLAAERPGILAAIQKFSDAFQHRSQKELKAIWLKPDADWLAAIGVKNATFQVALKSCLDHEMELDGEKAAIRCSLITSTTANAKLQEPTVSSVRVALRKVEGKWWILDPRH